MRGKLAVKTAKYLLVVFLIAALSGCDFFKGPPIKPGYTAVSIDDQKKMAALDVLLTKAKIDHYAYQDRTDARQYIAYPDTAKDKVEKLIDEVYGFYNPYDSTESYCFNTKKAQQAMLAALAANNITHASRRVKDEFCIYWPAEDDAKVEAVSPDYKQIRDACRAAPECRKTMASESGTGYRQH